MNDPSEPGDVQAAPWHQLLETVLVMEEEVSATGGPLLPAEAARVVRAVDKRRSEFTAGRVLARRALARLGVEQHDLGADSDGVPDWPSGFIGCITHACGRVAVAAAARTDVESLGIDMEAVARFHRGLEPHFLSPTEIALHLAAGPDAERQARAAILFCVKEAWFKCQFPLRRQRLGFLAAEVQVDWDSGHFAVLPAAGSRADAGVRGRSAVHRGIARAAIVLERGRLSAAARRAWQLPTAR